MVVEVPFRVFVSPHFVIKEFVMNHVDSWRKRLQIAVVSLLQCLAKWINVFPNYGPTRILAFVN